MPTASGNTPAWPYPRWIAHRGAGKLAPENTLAAFRLGASHGYRMFECDVKLSADGVPFLMHDATLERTTDGPTRLRANADGPSGDRTSMVGGEHPWSALSRLDAGRWHSPAYAGEPLPSFEAIASYCLTNQFFLNIEIKPTPDTEEETGRVVAEHAARLWQGQATRTALPFLTSFRPEALAAAKAARPELPRGLLIDTLWDGWLATAQALGCVAVVCNHKLADAAYMAQLRQAGLRALCYTVNDEAQVQRLLALGVDGIITDRVDLFKPD
jgi:glycerophosphoryl diester phosphodiesterase